MSGQEIAQGFAPELARDTAFVTGAASGTGCPR